MLCLWLGPPRFNSWISITPTSVEYTDESLALFYPLLYLDLHVLGDGT